MSENILKQHIQAKNSWQNSLSTVLLSNMRIHAADWWLSAQRYSASARHCLRDSGLPRILDKATIHMAKAMLLGQNSTSIERETYANRHSWRGMLRPVAIICQQLMNKFHYTIRLQQPVCKVADFKRT